MPGQYDGKLADEAAIQRAVESLSARNMEAIVVENGERALETLKELVPPGSEVYFSTSETLDAIGYTEFLHGNPG